MRCFALLVIESVPLFPALLRKWFDPFGVSTLRFQFNSLREGSAEKKRISRLSQSPDYLPQHGLSHDQLVGRSYNSPNERNISNEQEYDLDDTEAGKSESNKKCCLLKVVIPIIIIIVAFAIVIKMKYGKNQGQPSESEVFWDTWEGDSEYQMWTSPPASPDRTGLKITVINALTQDWSKYFDEAIEHWQDGSPRALLLFLKSTPTPDSNCRHVRGALKVCNGNYSYSSWTGVTEALFDNYGKITRSTDTMNYFYLHNDDIERRYVICYVM